MIKLITKNSIDEDMLAIGVTKLQLDDAVGGEAIVDGGQGGQDDKTAKEVRKSLLTTLRNKFDGGPGGEATAMEAIKEETEAQATPVKKKARGATQATKA